MGRPLQCPDKIGYNDSWDGAQIREIWRRRCGGPRGMYGGGIGSHGCDKMA